MIGTLLVSVIGWVAVGVGLFLLLCGALCFGLLLCAIMVAAGKSEHWREREW